jgi:hypothetical protein
VHISVNVIKYLYKYNFKGGDRDMASIGVSGQDGQPAQPRDGIAEFGDLQSCGTTEAFWILYIFEINIIYPTEQRLDVHFENQHRVVLQPGNEKRVLNEENVGKTTHAALFDFNSLNPEFLHHESCF